VGDFADGDDQVEFDSQEHYVFTNYAKDALVL